MCYRCDVKTTNVCVLRAYLGVSMNTWCNITHTHTRIHARTNMCLIDVHSIQFQSKLSFTFFWNSNEYIAIICLALTQITVTVQLVDRDEFSPIFTNTPQPLWTTCPVWIRPGTVIYTVRAVDSAMYGANVIYNLESGRRWFVFIKINNYWCHYSWSLLLQPHLQHVQFLTNNNNTLLLWLRADE